MAGPKASDHEPGPELCVNCGMPPCEVNSTILITLLFSKATRQVLCLEAGKDFVDTLMGFLTLPVGCIIKLLEAASMIHRPECKLAPPPSAPLVFPPGTPYTPRPKKGKNDAGEHFAMSSIANILDSVVKLNNGAMTADKNCLVDPKPATPFGAGKLLLLHNMPRSSNDQETQRSDVAMYYGCGNPCSFYSTTSATKCPKHKKKMSVPLKLVAGNAASGGDTPELGDEAIVPFAALQLGRISQTVVPSIVGTTRDKRGRQCASDSCATKPVQRSASRAQSRRSIRVKDLVPASACDSQRGLGLQLTLPSSPSSPAQAPISPQTEGYVKEGTKYMVTNTLEIYASSEAIKALITLNIIRAERVGDLDTMPVSVVTAEVLQLLKLSFTSTNVLNDVFGKYCADVNTAGFKDKKEPFFPQCKDKPCCLCSRMGTPMLALDSL